MTVNGRQIAEDIKQTLKKEIEVGAKKLELAIIQVGNDEVSAKFIKRKQKFAEDIGVKTSLYNFPENISTADIRGKIAEIRRGEQINGIIVQLPLPAHIEARSVLDGIPIEKDVDVLSAKAMGDFTANRSKILPPVVGAVKEILGEYKVKIKGKNAVVIGAGALVGKPAAIWLANQGAVVSVVEKHTPDVLKYTKEADIIVSGAGSPKLITPEMVKEGVVIIDAGTSFQDGKLVGDIDERVSKKASLFTPVPGGVGPLTVAMVFKNLVELNK